MVSFLWYCDKDEATALNNDIDITLKNSESYSYNLNISGDEEGAIIKVQAMHFQISELIRDSGTNWSVVYIYKPVSGYVGSDYVEIETCTGGDGINCSDIETVKINFEITD